jgi:hypothetical protein
MLDKMSNQSLQQTKPPVTVRACARPVPDVFAAEAGVRLEVAHTTIAERFCRYLAFGAIAGVDG